MAQTVKNMPPTRKTWGHSLDWEDPLEEGMATYSSILAWRIPWAEKPGRLESRGSQRARQLKQLGTHKHIYAHRYYFTKWATMYAGHEQTAGS